MAGANARALLLPPKQKIHVDIFVLTEFRRTARQTRIALYSLQNQALIRKGWLEEGTCSSGRNGRQICQLQLLCSAIREIIRFNRLKEHKPPKPKLDKLLAKVKRTRNLLEAKFSADHPSTMKASIKRPPTTDAEIELDREPTLQEIVNVKLTESGEKERLKELLRERLVECGWRDEMKALCREFARKKGRNNVTVDELVNVITQKEEYSLSL
ncbi:hypothetical protein Pfo_024363 [Paulownia fortunei]|nr:hypothetical protein Pfo_024363 [Paulownia fortunei]